MDTGEQSQEELVAPEEELEVVSNEEVAEETEEVETTDDDESEQTDAESATEEDEYVEVERNGKTYQVPKELEGEFLMQSDYTKKRQADVEKYEQFEAQRKSFEEQQAFQNAHFNEILTAKQLEAELARYENADWNALYDADPVEAMKLDRQRTALKEQYQASVTKINQAQQYQTLTQQQESAKLIEQSQKVLASEIKDWSPQVAKEVGEYIQSYKRLGLTDQDIKDIDSGKHGAVAPIVFRKAQLYDQLIKKSSVKPPPPPVTKIGTKASVSKSPADMNPKEFAAWRKRAISNR